MTILQDTGFRILTQKGYKVLLKDYECPLGQIDFITKKDGFLVFVLIDREWRESERRAARYYLKRYGIKDVPTAYETISQTTLRVP